MKHGSEWYKREPAAYLGGVQGMTAKEHAVYSVTLDLIYQHGGSVNNDPSWIAGWIKDMGASAVRKALDSLDCRGKLIIDGDQITQKRAKTEAKTKENLRETARENGKKGGEKSAEIRVEASRNSNLPEPIAKTENQAYKTREDKTIEEKKDKRVTAPRISNADLVLILSNSVSANVAASFIQHRKDLKKPMTENMANAIVKKLEGHHAPDAVLTDSIANGWQGIFPEKIKTGGRNDQSYKNSPAQRSDPALEQALRLAGVSQAQGNAFDGT
tara:strand:- start:1150 stop:1965 length:816 start_codon:yes stop_codon:yes gene_type:complete